MTTDAEIKIGVVATLIGPIGELGREAVVGVKMAIDEFGGSVAGKPIRLSVESSNAIPDSAVDAVQLLLNHGVDFVIGPLSGNEGLAVRDYARTRPDKAFINGCSAAQDMTLRNPAPNFFNFATDAVQNMAGLGTYAYHTMGYRRMVTLAEDYSYPHGLVGGFMIEFCRAGGKIEGRYWVHLGQQEFSEFFAAVPRDIDAILVCLTGNDAVQFIRQYAEAGLTISVVGGASTFESAALYASGEAAAALVGTPSASPISESNPDPKWQAFLSAYRSKSPRGASAPSFPTYGYYVNTRAALLALDAVGGDLSAGQENFQAALAGLEFESPTGVVRLDHNRQVIANVFINVLDQRDDGTVYNRLVETTPGVNQTLGIPEEQYLALGSLGRDTDVEAWLQHMRL